MSRTLQIFYISLLKNFKNNEIYNICDDKPAPQGEVVALWSKTIKIKSTNPYRTRRS